MSLASILGFSFAMAVLAASPGPAFFILISRSMSSGAIAGAGVLAGVIVGDVVFLILALLGVSAVSQALGSLFIVVKLFGGAYIIWLGIKMWRQKPIAPDAVKIADKRGFSKGFTEGLAVNLTNPKAIIFFAALLPTFVDVASVTMMDGLILAGIVVGVGVLIDGSYILLATRAARLLRSEKAQTRLNRIGGATLAAVGAAVVAR